MEEATISDILVNLTRAIGDCIDIEGLPSGSAYEHSVPFWEIYRYHRLRHNFTSVRSQVMDQLGETHEHHWGPA